MSRRTAIIEEEFDDDTDLALPAKSLPNTGTQGAILEAVSDDEGDSEAGPATPSYSQFRAQEAASGGVPAGMRPPANQVTDLTPYKKCVSHSLTSTARSANIAPTTQVDMRIPHLHRRKARIRHRPETRPAREGRVVAAKQGHGGGSESSWVRHASRSAEVPPQGLGEPWPRARAVEEGREAREPKDQE